MSWESNVRKVVPYVPGEQPVREQMVKLNTNECPYPPSPEVEKILQKYRTEQLRLYPDPETSVLNGALAGYYGFSEEQIFTGIGSDDVLAMAFLTFFQGGKPVLFPDITYSFYEVWAELFGVPYQKIPLNKSFRICREDYCSRPDCGGIIFPNPNAPTGILESVEFIEEIVKTNPDSVVIIDEAYIDFGGKTCLPLIHKYDNLLVAGTFSKSRALAGMRIGFAVGSPKLIEYLKNAKFSFNSYTMSSLAMECGAAALEDDVWFHMTLEKIMKTRERTAASLKGLGFFMTDSKANFLFVSHPEYPAAQLYQDLREKNIFVRYFPKPGIDEYLRITIGTDEEMDRLLKELENLMNEREKQ